MTSSPTPAVHVNGRTYQLPRTPTVVVCVDGCEPDYIAQAVASCAKTNPQGSTSWTLIQGLWLCAAGGGSSSGWVAQGIHSEPIAWTPLQPSCLALIRASCLLG